MVILLLPFFQILLQIIFSRKYKAPGRKPCDRYEEAKSTAAEYGFQICKGLKAIHAAGFLHRNLQPNAILVKLAFTADYIFLLSNFHLLNITKIEFERDYVLTCVSIYPILDSP